MRRFSLNLIRAAILVCVFAGLFAKDGVAQEKRIIQLEVSVSQRAELTTQHRWMEVLSKVGADSVRSMTTVLSRGPEIKELKNSGSTIIKVVGRINGNTLQLPGKTFSIRDPGGIQNYLAGLRVDGSEMALAEKHAFGLTSEQLVQVHESLAGEVDISTLDKPVSDVVGHIFKKVDLELVLTSASRDVMRNDGRIKEELKGLSYGTALAAILRPWGKVLNVERKPGKAPRFAIANYNEVSEFWPVGWPNDKRTSEVHPKLMERQPIEIRNYSLSAVLDALQKRTEIPFLYDRNSIAKAGVDIAGTRVTIVKKQVAYKVAIQDLLSQTRPRLRAELRIDEAEKPFLWISTASQR